MLPSLKDGWMRVRYRGRRKSSAHYAEMSKGYNGQTAVSQLFIV